MALKTLRKISAELSLSLDGDAMVDLDAIVENFTDIDENVFELWLRGLSVNEATDEILKTKETQEWGADIPGHCSLQKVVSMDTADHYRLFTELEKILACPQRLAEDCTHQIAVQQQSYIIEKYYTLDSSVVREIISKKLTGRNRRDLDDVAEKTGVLLRSCRRQFDNIKCIFKQVEEMSGSLVTLIKSNFLLSEALSRKYAAIVFLLLNRFETSKRKLNYVTFEDFYECAFALMQHWSGDDDTATDRDFLIQLRDLKSLSDREKEHKSLLINELHKSGGCPVAEAELNMKIISRPLCTIATALHTPKELRDLFVDIVERIIEPVKSVKWTTEQLSAFLTAYTTAGSLLFDGSPSTKQIWERYMKAMTVCITQLYHM